MRGCRRLVVLLVLVAIAGVAVANDGDPDSVFNLPDPYRPLWTKRAARPYWRRNLFKRLAGDQRFLFTSWLPADANRPGFWAPLLVCAVGASGSAAGGPDYEWSASIDEWATRNGSRADAFAGFSALGDSSTAAALLGTTYVLAHWTGNTRLKRATSLSTEAMMNVFIYSFALKRAFRRTRPVSGAAGEFFVDRPEPGRSNASFPSGHAMGAFAVAAVFAREYRDRRWVRFTVYGTAGMIAFSRVALGRHFLSDALAGAVLGDSIGRMVSVRGGGKDEAGRPGWRNLFPIVDRHPGGLGVGFRYAW